MRIHGLDSIRGMAAFVVVINHLYNVIPELNGDDHWLFNYTPAYWLIAGRCAVLLFFVLSGYVLTLPYEGARTPRYKPYLIKRFCRIYVPFAVAIGISALVIYPFTHPFPDWAPPEIGQPEPLTLGLLASHLLITGVNASSTSLDLPTWSLFYEMRVSLVFPLIVLAVHRFGVKALLGAVVVGMGCAKGFAALDGGDNFYVARSGLGAVLLTVYYVPFFMIGSWAAHNRNRVNAAVERLPVWAHAGLMLLFLLVPHGFLKAHFSFTDYYYAAFAVYVIAGSQVWGRFAAMLVRPFFLWLGRISFSLYLVHQPLLLLVLFNLHDVLPMWAVLAVALGVSLMAGEMFCRWVEMPAMRLGKRLAG